MRLDVNNDAVVKHTVTLEKLRKSALPSAIRGALNDAAFDVKQKTMPVTAKAQFIQRSPNFFKANSSVDMARGFDVNHMRASVGFIESRLRLGSDHNFAVKDLEQQEYSGRISGKSFIPLDDARVGGYTTLVKPANRLSRILRGRVIVAKNLGRGSATKKQLFVKAIHKAGPGGYVIGSNIKGENLLWRVDSIRAQNNFSLTPLYSYRRGRKVKVKEKGFMRTASMRSAGKLNGFYINQIRFWVNKYKK